MKTQLRRVRLKNNYGQSSMFLQSRTSAYILVTFSRDRRPKKILVEEVISAQLCRILYFKGKNTKDLKTMMPHMLIGKFHFLVCAK